jgi:hypothetical protein
MSACPIYLYADVYLHCFADIICTNYCQPASATVRPLKISNAVKQMFNTVNYMSSHLFFAYVATSLSKPIKYPPTPGCSSMYDYVLALNYSILVGFGRACAPVRCAHPSFDLIATPDGALRPPPAYRSFAAFISPPKLSISSNSIARGVYLSFGLSCTLLSYIASY